MERNPIQSACGHIAWDISKRYIIDGVGYSGLIRSNGLILIAFFIIFLYYVFGIPKSSVDLPRHDDLKELSYLKSVIFIITGLIRFTMEGKWIVDGAVKISQSFNVSQSFIGLTIVAVGTSLPELATSLCSCRL